MCALEDLIEGAGVGALVAGRQIALFLLHGRVYALDNFDPASRADLKPSAAVFINAAERQPDGTYTAPRVNVGLNGEVPPM